VRYCDHCGKEVPCTSDELFAFMGTDAAYLMGSIHGCSKEHLGFAVAKAFGIPIDGNLASRVDELLRATRNIPALEGMLKNVTENYEQHKKESAVQIDELQRKLTAAQYEADEAKERISRLEHGAPRPTRPVFAGNDHPHEVGSCGYCDKELPAITDPQKPTKPLQCRKCGATVEVINIPNVNVPAICKLCIEDIGQ
jgi:hypothetical protein